MPSRLWIDVSTSLRWAGPPVGIARADAELALAAQRLCPAVRLMCFAPAENAFYEAPPDLLRQAARGAITLVSLGRRPWERPARAGFAALEWRRYAAWRKASEQGPPPRHAPLAERLRPRKWANAEQLRLRDVRVLGARAEPAAGDVVLSGGLDWSPQFRAALAALRSQRGVRLSLLCYDLIPIQFPRLCGQDHPFRGHTEALAPIVDQVISISQAVERDARVFFAARGLSPAFGVCRLGEDASTLPLGEAGGPPPAVAGAPYVLYVSTIENRKGHRVAIDAWERLQRAGVLARTGAKLCLVGRVGWGVSDLMQELHNSRFLEGSVTHLPRVTDAELASLYRHAAFSVFPSLYEGYGLPAVEAMRFGKVCVVSSAGALPEVTQGLCPVLDPLDTPAWTAMLERLLTDRDHLAAWEAKVAQRRSVTWADAAEACLRLTTA